MQYFHYVLVTNQHNDQLTTVGLLAQLLEHYTGIAKIMGPILVQPIFFIFFWLNFRYCFKSVLNCDDRLHLLIHSSNTWHLYVYSGLVYHLDNQYLHFYFRALFSYNLMRNLLQYFYQVPYKGLQYIAVLLATPLSCCSQTLLTSAILNNSSMLLESHFFQPIYS